VGTLAAVGTVVLHSAAAVCGVLVRLLMRA